MKYIGDWVYDDEPTVIKTTNGPLVTLPYTIECNDIPVMIVQHHNSDYLLQLVKDQFDRLYAESEKRAKFVALAIHPYISGQPHRIKYLEQIYDYVNKHEGVLHWNGEQILDWYAALRKSEPPPSLRGDPIRTNRHDVFGRTTMSIKTIRARCHRCFGLVWPAVAGLGGSAGNPAGTAIFHRLPAAQRDGASTSSSRSTPSCWAFPK